MPPKAGPLSHEKKKDKAPISPPPKPIRSKEKDAQGVKLTAEQKRAAKKLAHETRTRTRTPAPSPLTRTDVAISAKRMRLSLSPAKKIARFQIGEEESDTDPDPSPCPTVEDEGRIARNPRPPTAEQSAAFATDGDYRKLAPIAPKLRSLERDLSRAIFGSDDFARIEGEEIIQTDQYLRDCCLPRLTSRKLERPIAISRWQICFGPVLPLSP